MSRYVPALLVCLLACTSQLKADDTFPSLDQRLGKTITVVEKNYPTEKAVITQVWRLEDGTPVMQAKTQTSQTQLTLVENTAAKTAAERIKVYRWTNDVRPVGCPLAPVMPAQVVLSKTMEPVKKVDTIKVDVRPAVTVAPARVMPVTQSVVVKAEPVTSIDGGLVPVLVKKDEPKTVTTVAASMPVATAMVKKSDVVVPNLPVPPVAKEVPVLPTINTTVVTTPAPQVPAVLKTTVVTTPVQAQAPATVAQPAASSRELVGGCEVITITENGTARKYKILGTARDAHGAMTHRCQALDNNEIVTLNCDTCAKACNTCAPAQVACASATPCVPVPVHCEPCKPACPPVTVKTECKPCDPVQVACEPAKPCVPCAKPACDPCQDKCNKGDLAHGAGDCGNHCAHSTLYDDSCKRARPCRTADINVPVPGVRLQAVNGIPGGPPPQPLIPAFCTMNSSSVRAYMCAPQLVPMVCMEKPFGDCLNNQIAAGIHQMNPGNGEAVTATMHLINVLAQSKEWENRQWAAQRLQQATLPTVRPYVEDALLTAAQHDRAPLVKVAAIRTLASMNSTRPDVVNMLAYAAADADPRIKEAAADAIQVLYKQNGVQQAGYSK